MEDFQKRMLIEEEELKTKLKSLNAWLSQDKVEVINQISLYCDFPELYYLSLLKQQSHMQSYLSELLVQIGLWEVN